MLFTYQPMKKKILISVVRVFGTVAIIVLIIGYLIAQPTFRSNQFSTITIDTDRLEMH